MIARKFMPLAAGVILLIIAYALGAASLGSRSAAAQIAAQRNRTIVGFWERRSPALLSPVYTVMTANGDIYERPISWKVRPIRVGNFWDPSVKVDSLPPGYAERLKRMLEPLIEENTIEPETDSE